MSTYVCNIFVIPRPKPINTIFISSCPLPPIFNSKLNDRSFINQFIGNNLKKYLDENITSEKALSSVQVHPKGKKWLYINIFHQRLKVRFPTKFYGLLISNRTSCAIESFHVLYEYDGRNICGSCGRIFIHPHILG